MHCLLNKKDTTKTTLINSLVALLSWRKNFLHIVVRSKILLFGLFFLSKLSFLKWDLKRFLVVGVSRMFEECKSFPL